MLFMSGRWKIKWGNQAILVSAKRLASFNKKPFKSASPQSNGFISYFASTLISSMSHTLNVSLLQNSSYSLRIASRLSLL